MSRFQHSSTILMMALPHGITQYLSKMAIVIRKIVAKLKTSRRSDMIGYVGSGIFGMLLQHSDISSPKKASQRLLELLQNVFLGSDGLHMAKIKPNYVLLALHLAQQNKLEYIVYKEDSSD